MDIKKIIKIVLGLSIAGVAIYFFLKSSDLNEIAKNLKRMGVLPTFLAIFLSIFSLYMRGKRWGYILPKRKDASNKGLFQLATISFMLNNILPLRIGEAARVYLLHKKNNYTVHVSLGSLIFERIVDSIFYSLFIIVPAYVYSSQIIGKQFFGTINVSYIVTISYFVLAGVIVIFILYRLFPELIFNIGNAVAKKMFHPIRITIEHLLKLIKESTEWLFDFKKIMMVLFLSIPTIFSYALILYVIAQSIGANITPIMAMFVGGVIALGVTIPSSPGFIGTLHLACIQGLSVFGVDTNLAAAIAILYHLITWSSTVIVGLIFYFKMNISVKTINDSNILETGTTNE